MLKKILYIIVITVFSSFYASADTTDQKWMKKVEVTKSGDHCVDDKNCFNLELDCRKAGSTNKSIPSV